MNDASTRSRATRAGSDAPERLQRLSWLLLIHQIPPKPDYLRVKIGRRLHTLGAVAIKNAVYALPQSEQAREDFEWLRQEIEASGGTAFVCAAAFIDGLTDAEIRATFAAARDSEYADVAAAARALLAEAETRAVGERDVRVRKLRERLAQIGGRDFFGAPGRADAETLLARVERAAGGLADERAVRPPPLAIADYRGRVWVTRSGIGVDRMASAWLIRRAIDPRAKLSFVPKKRYSPKRGELRFDMLEAEFTHEGERCTFEVLLERFGFEEPALRAIAEIVHDIDLKDGKFALAETAGVAAVIDGIARPGTADKERLAAAMTLLDALRRHFAARA